MKKKLLTTLLSLSALCGLFGLAACGGDTTTSSSSSPNEEHLAYLLSADETYYTVTGMGNITGTDVVIPATYNDLPVTTIDAQAFSRSDCTSVTFAENSQVTSILDMAFYECEDLTSIAFPASVNSIGSSVFDGCVSLASITVDENNEHFQSIDKNLYSKDGKTLIKYATAQTATEFTLPNSVTTIESSAASNSANLKSVTLGSEVTTVGNFAFYGCAGLTSVTMGGKVTAIGDSAFKNCEALTSMTLPNGVTSIGANAFERCTSLESITLPDTITTIGTTAFSDCSSLANVSIPDGVTVLSPLTFVRCSSLKNITIPANVRKIGHQAFYGCTKLTSVTFVNPVGWSADGTDVRAADLRDTAKAARYLTDTQSSAVWLRATA